MSFEYEYTKEDMGSTVIHTASFGVRGGPTWKKWMPCAICGQAFREDQFEWYEGRAYGVPCGDYKDIISKRRKRRGDTISRRRGREEVVED